MMKLSYECTKLPRYYVYTKEESDSHGLLWFLLLPSSVSVVPPSEYSISAFEYPSVSIYSSISAFVISRNFLEIHQSQFILLLWHF